MRTLLISFIAILTVTGLQNIDFPPQPRAMASQETKTVTEAVKQPVKKKVVKDATKKRKASTKPVVQPRAISKPIPTSNSSDVVSIITKAAVKHGIDPARALRIANCESTLNPRAQNTGYYAGGGHPTGLFQYLPETWNRIGSRSPYGVGDIYSAQDQANVTMWAWANGYASEWECS